jgi:hypothetical protein
MELEKRIASLEKLPIQIAKVGGTILAVLAILTVGVFEFAKLVKYLWMSF